MENQDNNKPNNTGRFNSYWIYGLLALFLLALNFYSITNSSNDPLEWNKFAEMVRANDINNIAIINKEYAEVFIKEEAF